MKTEQTESGGFIGSTGGHESAATKAIEDAFGKAFTKILDRGDEARAWQIIEQLLGKRFADELDRILQETPAEEPEGERFRSPRHGKSTAELFGTLLRPDEFRS